MKQENIGHEGPSNAIAHFDFFNSADGRLFTRAFIDVSLGGMSYLLAMYLRLGHTIFDYMDTLFFKVGVFMAVCGVCFSFMGLSLNSWRFTSAQDIMLMIRGIILAVIVFAIGDFLLTRLDSVPRSVPMISCFIMITTMGACRLIYNSLSERPLQSEKARPKGGAPPSHLLAYGATLHTEMLLKSLQSDPAREYEIVGIVDDDPLSRDRRVRGVQVLGATKDLPRITEALAKQGRAPKRLVVPNRSLSAEGLTKIVERAAGSGLRVLRLPHPSAFLQCGSHPLELQPIEVEDLLSRTPHNLDLRAIAALIRGKSVIVTGGGGSIGSQLCRLLLERDPAKLVIIDHSEFNLFAINRELSAIAAQGVLEPVLASVRDSDAIRRIFLKHKPDLVFHAAAYKHVPLVEMNPLEGVLTNVIGTAHVADAAAEANASAMIMISTDKAVKPSSIMGLSKRVAEMYCQSLDFGQRDAKRHTRFLVVRFGNVLGSSGSVVPIFEHQIRLGGPVTITHRDMTRFFMTIGEAVGLVLQASVYGCSHNESRGAILVLDMGEPVPIIDLAHRMITLAGFLPERDIPIKVVGIREGEKLHEELFDDDEIQEPTSMSGVRLARSRARDPETMDEIKVQIQSLIASGKREELIQLLNGVVSRREALLSQPTCDAESGADFNWRPPHSALETDASQAANRQGLRHSRNG